MESSRMVQVHEFYLRYNLRVLEIPRGKKCPVVPDWPNAKRSYDEVNRELCDARYNKYGWLLDEGHLVIDIDLHREDENGLESLERLTADSGVDIYGECGAIVHSPSGGLHFYFRMPEGVRFGKQFRAKYPGIDFIHGKGKQVIAAGSCHDAYPGEYHLGAAGELRDVPQKLLDYLVALRPEPASAPSIPDGDRSGDDFNTSTRGLQIMLGALQSRGYAVRQAGDYWEWDRPGKTTDATCSGHVGKRSKQGNYQLTCFTLSDEAFPSGESLSIFHAYALLLHHGNHAAAADDLYRLGFAARPGIEVDLSGFMAPPAQPAEVSLETPAPEFPYDCIDDMPGAMRDAFEYSRANSIRFMPEAALLGLIGLFSSLLGRRVRDNYNSRTNPILIALASSGSGKNSQRECNKNLAVAAGLTHLLGPERIGSAQGIVTAVARVPNIFFQLDEAGELLKAVNNPRSHLQHVPGLMMHLYSDCKSTWTSDAVSDERRVRTIHQPNPVYYGTSTPEVFYENVTEAQLVDGFLNRMMLFLCATPKSRRQPALTDPKPELLNWMRAWASYVPPGAGNLTDSGVDVPKPLLVQKTQDAHAAHEEYTDQVIDRHSKETPVRAALWSRAPEKEAKLALVYACASGLPADSPQITIEAINWAKRLVNYSTRFMVWAAEERAQSSEALRLKQRVLDKIESGMTRSEITRKTQFLKNARERRELMDELVEAGCISVDKATGKYLKVRGSVRG